MGRDVSGAVHRFYINFAPGIIQGEWWYELSASLTNLPGAMLGWHIEVTDYGIDGLTRRGLVLGTTETIEYRYHLKRNGSLFGGLSFVKAADNVAVKAIAIPEPASYMIVSWAGVVITFGGRLGAVYLDSAPRRCKCSTLSSFVVSSGILHICPYTNDQTCNGSKCNCLCHWQYVGPGNRQREVAWFRFRGVHWHPRNVEAGAHNECGGSREHKLHYESQKEDGESAAASMHEAHRNPNR